MEPRTTPYRFTFTLQQQDYAAIVPPDLRHYILEKRNKGTDVYEKVAAMSRAEARRFPVAAGYVATAFLHGLRHQEAA